VDLPDFFADFVRRLTAHQSSDHFQVWYQPATVLDGPPVGKNAVRDSGLVPLYLDSLELLYKRMRDRHGWPAPVTDESGKTQVYVGHLPLISPSWDSPLMYYDRGRIPFIALPSRSREPAVSAVQQQAAASAVHEATHVFQFSLRETTGRHHARWNWFDESVAMYMESALLPDNHFWLNGYHDWYDATGVALDASEAQYCGLFPTWLTKRFGEELLLSVCQSEEACHGPLRAIDHEVKKTAPAMVSSTPGVFRMFADYCDDAYFLTDAESHAHIEAVRQRFGVREATEYRTVAPGEPLELTTASLTKLSCCHYVIRGRRPISRMQVVVRPNPADAIGLRGSLAVAALTADGLKRLQHIELLSAGGTTLRATIADLDAPGVDHVVLTLANCGTEAIHRLRSCTVTINAGAD
jgi:hypothetical protein